MSRVDLAEMDKIGQLFDRQKEYLTSGQGFLSANAAPRGFTGVLSFLEGHYQRCYEAGTKGMGNGVAIADKCSRTIKANYAQYVADDRAAYEQLNKHNKNAPPYQPPTGTLGAGGQPGQPSGPGAAQRVWDGTKWVTAQAKTAGEHADTAFGLHNRGANNSAKRKELGKLGDQADDKSMLGGKDTNWFEDPWGTAKGKASDYVKEWQAKAAGYKSAEAQESAMTQEYRDAYRDKRADVRQDQRANGQTPNDTRPFVTPSAEKQQALNGAIDAVQKPAELIDAAEGVYDAGKGLLDEIQRAASIQRLKNTDNTGSSTWANDSGGTW